MIKYAIEAGIILFVVLFMRITIMDTGFLVGFKNKIGFGVPVQVVEYESQQSSWMRKVESQYGLMQVASGYSFVVVGKYDSNWFFFDALK